MAEEFVPAFEGQRPPFQPGHELTLQHGAYSPRKVEPLARELVEAVLTDPTVPAYAKASAYRAELWALARSEAQVQLLSEFLMARGTATEDAADGGALGDLGDERVRTAYLLLHRAETRAASARSRLGLTPVAAARMGKDVAVGRAADTDVAVRMAAMHEAEQRAVERLRAEGWRSPEEVAALPAGDDQAEDDDQAKDDEAGDGGEEPG